MKLDNIRMSNNVEDLRPSALGKVQTDATGGFGYGHSGAVERDLNTLKTRKVDPTEALAKTGGISPGKEFFSGFDKNYPTDGPGGPAAGMLKSNPGGALGAYHNARIEEILKK